jgi:hypothetical protein
MKGGDGGGGCGANTIILKFGYNFAMLMPKIIRKLFQFD